MWSIELLKKCDVNLNCKISEKSSNLSIELQKEILKKAAIYEKQNIDKNFKPYTTPKIGD